MNSEIIIMIVGFSIVFLFITIFSLFKTQFFILLNRLARINVRGAKNLQYTNEDIEPEIQIPSSPILLTGTKQVLPTGIEFEGSYDKESFRKKTALIIRPSKETAIRRLIISLISVLALIPLLMYIQLTKQYFSLVSLLVLLMLSAIYYLTIHPFVYPYFAILQASTKSKEDVFHKGIISSEGITYISLDNFESTPWVKVYRVKQTDDLIVLFADYSPPMVFPRSFFKSEVDWQQFERWVDFYAKRHL